jgi:hypothetical protein
MFSCNSFGYDSVSHGGLWSCLVTWAVSNTSSSYAKGHVPPALHCFKATKEPRILIAYEYALYSCWHNYEHRSLCSSKPDIVACWPEHTRERMKPGERIVFGRLKDVCNVPSNYIRELQKSWNSLFGKTWTVIFIYLYFLHPVVYHVTDILRGRQHSIWLQKYTKIFNIRVILFSFHYLFRSIKIVIRWFLWITYVFIELLKLINFYSYHLVSWLKF